ASPRSLAITRIGRTAIIAGSRGAVRGCAGAGSGGSSGAPVPARVASPGGVHGRGARGSDVVPAAVAARSRPLQREQPPQVRAAAPADEQEVRQPLHALLEGFGAIPRGPRIRGLLHERED